MGTTKIMNGHEERIDQMIEKEFNSFPHDWQYHDRDEIIQTALYWGRFELVERLRDRI